MSVYLSIAQLRVFLKQHAAIRHRQLHIVLIRLLRAWRLSLCACTGDGVATSKQREEQTHRWR